MYPSTNVIKQACQEACQSEHRKGKRIARYVMLVGELNYSLHYGCLVTIQFGCIDRRLGFCELQALVKAARERLPILYVDEDGEWQFRKPRRIFSDCYAEIDVAEYLTPREAKPYI